MPQVTGMGEDQNTIGSFNLWGIFRDASLVVAVAAGIGLVFNAARPHGIPFIQKEPYHILVPCPEKGGDVESLSPRRFFVLGPRALVIDAQLRDGGDHWHFPGARLVPYDYLTPTPPEVIKQIVDSGARRVVVYGDGENPDSGEQLARELSGKGIRRVAYVVGGAPALRSQEAGGKKP